MFKKIFTAYVFWRLLLFVFSILAIYIIPFRKAFTAFNYGTLPPYHLFIWGNFDGYHYMKIAQIGYLPHLYPFFPLFPLLIRFFVRVLDVHWWLRAGQLVSNISFILSLYIVYKLTLLDGKKFLIPLIFLIIFFYPTSFYYTAVYNDSLFFLLATTTIYFARKRAWIIASVFGALATLTRLNGLALIFLIGFEYLSTTKSFKQITPKRILKDSIYAVLLIPLAFAGFLFHIHKISGNFMNVFSAMAQWNQDKVTFPLQVVWRYMKIFALVSPQQLIYWIAVLEFASVVLYLFLLIYSFKKVRFSYWIFFAVSILIPSLTGTFAGMPRYGLHLYPFFLSLALFLEKRSEVFRIIWFAICFLLLFLLVSLFTRGYFVS